MKYLELNWTKHITIMQQKLSSLVLALYRYNIYINDNNKKITYYTLIETHFRQLIAELSNTTKYLTQKIIEISKQVSIKSLYHKHHCAPTFEVFSTVGLKLHLDQCSLVLHLMHEHQKLNEHLYLNSAHPECPAYSQQFLLVFWLFHLFFLFSKYSIFFKYMNCILLSRY